MEEPDDSDVVVHCHRFDKLNHTAKGLFKSVMQILKQPQLAVARSTAHDVYRETVAVVPQHPLDDLHFVLCTQLSVFLPAACCRSPT